MTEEDLLRRWSRRKREAALKPDQPVRPEEATKAPPPTAAERVLDPEPEIDLSALPPIDSITAASDITAFLRKGIPKELTHAALRRAWSADPAIRDFIGLAENAWDFNDPNAMPGFGPLDCSAEQLQALLGRVMGSAQSIAENLADSLEEPGIDRQSGDSRQLPTSQPQPQADSTHGVADETSTDAPQRHLAAMQPDAPRDVVNDETATVRRTHGSALPR